MFRILLYSVLLLVVFDVIPHRTSSTPLSRVLRSPSTTPESHISNFLHQHRTDSRADKPDEHPVNATADPLHHHTTTTSTEAPLTQTELITNILHTVLHSVRERFPGLIDAINAISAPKAPPPKSLHHHKRLIKHHLQSIQDRSTNASSVEDSTEDDELSLEEDEEEPEDAGPENNVPSLIPSSLIKVILEASGSSAARGSASASAGSVASSSGSSSSSSSGGSGNGRSNENESQGSGSGDFLVSKIQYKARALASLVFAPLLGAYTFVQRSLGAASGSSSGSGSIPSGSGAFPEPEYHPNHHHHADGHHHHPDGHHHHNGDHQGEDHHYHSSEHDHNQNHHAENVTSADGVTHIVGGDDVKESLHKLAFRNAFYKYTNLMTKGTFNETTADPLLATNSDGPLHVVLDNGGLDYDADNPTEIVSNNRQSRSILNEGFGIYVLEILGSIAGLTWGAFNQIQNLFGGREEEQDSSAERFR